MIFSSLQIILSKTISVSNSHGVLGIALSQIEHVILFYYKHEKYSLTVLALNWSLINDHNSEKAGGGTHWALEYGYVTLKTQINSRDFQKML